ncbi:MAG TPA: HAMP domain-containing sensor histidine kinase [Gaiellaceae bacterium]|nr:HAMP domain-containing sensor histidine kinase [Gaiellaceae bacterium]
MGLDRRTLSSYGFLAAGVGAIALYVALPPGAVADGLYSAIGFASAIGLWVAGRRTGRGTRCHWCVFSLGIGLMVAGDTLFSIFALEGWSTKTPCAADGLYLLSYPTLALGFVLLLRRAGARASGGRLGDAAIVALGLSAVLWAPYFSNFDSHTHESIAGRVTLAAYPTWDLLLLALASALLFSRSVAGRWAQLLALAAALLLAADLVWALAPDSYTAGDWMDRGWLLSYVTWAAAGLHPSAAKPVEVRPARAGATWHRVALLSLAVLAAPVDFTVDALRGTGFTVVDGAIAITLVLAVMLRLGAALRGLDTAREVVEDHAEQLRASEERFRRIFTRATVGMALVDEEGVIMGANERFARMLGRRSADLVGTNGLDFIQPEDRDAVAARWRDEFAGNHTDAVQRRVLDADGNEVWTLAGVAVLSDGMAVISCQDITALKRYEESLREADRQKDELISVVSHDLRTPLTSIVGYLELALEAERDPVLGAQLSDFLRISMRNAQRLSLLVEQLLFVTRAHAGRAELDLEEVAVDEVVRDVVESARPEADAKQLAITVTGGRPVAVADPHRFTEAVENLLSNAIKFTPESGSVELELREDGAFVTLVVRDSGPGIDADDLPHVFERFYRARSAEGIPGNGIGLAIVEAIASAHGGSVRAADRPEGGAEFELSVPRAGARRLRAA